MFEYKGRNLQRYLISGTVQFMKLRGSPLDLLTSRNTITFGPIDIIMNYVVGIQKSLNVLKI